MAVNTLTLIWLCPCACGGYITCMGCIYWGSGRCSEGRVDWGNMYVQWLEVIQKHPVEIED